MTGELIDHGGRLRLPEQTVVDQDAGELVADRPAEERCDHGGVDTARQAADHPVAADPPPDLFDLCRGEVVEPPVPGAAAGLDEKISEDRAARWGVRDLRVELQTVDGQRTMADGGERAGGRSGEWHEILRDAVDLVAVAHPDIRLRGHPGEERRLVDHLTGRPPVFAGGGLPHAAAQGVACQLHAVADAEHGNPQPKQRGVAPRGSRLVDARRASREDDAPGGQIPDPLRGDVVADDLAVHVLLPNPAGDQLRVLRPEVEDEHLLGLLPGLGRRAWRRRGDTGCR